MLCTWASGAPAARSNCGPSRWRTADDEAALTQDNIAVTIVWPVRLPADHSAAARCRLAGEQEACRADMASGGAEGSERFARGAAVAMDHRLTLPGPVPAAYSTSVSGERGGKGAASVRSGSGQKSFKTRRPSTLRRYRNIVGIKILWVTARFTFAPAVIVPSGRFPHFHFPSTIVHDTDIRCAFGKSDNFRDVRLRDLLGKTRRGW